MHSLRRCAPRIYTKSCPRLGQRLHQCMAGTYLQLLTQSAPTQPGLPGISRQSTKGYLTQLLALDSNEKSSNTERQQQKHFNQHVDPPRCWEGRLYLSALQAQKPLFTVLCTQSSSSNKPPLVENDLGKFLVVNYSVPIHVSLANHLINLRADTVNSNLHFENR